MSETRGKTWIDLTHAAEHLCISKRKAINDWPEWEKFGVHARKMGRRKLFKVAELDAMVEQHRIN